MFVNLKKLNDINLSIDLLIINLIIFGSKLILFIILFILILYYIIIES